MSNIEEDYNLFQLVKRNPINSCIDLSKNMIGKKRGVFYFTERFRIDFENKMSDFERLKAEREQDKNRLQELEEHLKKYYDGEIYTAKQLKQIEENQKKYFINKQKVKDEIERYEYMIAETIHGKIQKYTPGEILLKIDTLKELLEEK